MVSIRSFKKGDWVGLSFINTLDEENHKYSADKTYFLYFLTDTNCIVGLSKEYSNKDKYWFDLKIEELINTSLISRKELIEKFDNYDIEPLKYKRKKEKYWTIYERPKKDYNWKYDIACGANPDWVIFKRDMINDYIKEMKNKNDYQDKVTYNCLVNSFDVFLDEITLRMNSKGCFNFSRPNYGDGNIVKKEDYYDVMLNNYYVLHFKYGHKILNDIYYMLLDFEKLVSKAKKNNKFSDIDNLIVDMTMKGNKIDYIVDEVNKLKQTKHPLTKEKIALRLSVDIPKILMKLDGELNG